MLIAAGVVGLGVTVVAGRSLFGSYSQTAGLPRFPPGLWQNMLTHAAHVVVGAGILPAILWLGWAARTSVLRTDRRHYSFAILSVLLVVFIFYEVGFFSQNVVGGRIQERTAFYPVLLFALGVAALSSDLRSRGPRLSLLAAAVAVALVIGAAAFGAAEAAAPFEAIANPGASYNGELNDAVSGVSKLFLGHSLVTAEGLAVVALALGVIGTIAAAPRFRRTALPVLAGLTLVFCVVETNTVLARDVRGVNSAIPGVLGSSAPPKAWVDGALYASGGEAGALESPLFGADASTVWLWVEFWNKQITRLYVPAGGTSYSGLPALPFSVDPATGVVRTPLEKPYLVVSATDPRLALQGSVVRRGPFGLNVLKPVRPYRAAWTVLGHRWDPLESTCRHASLSIL